MKTPEDVINRFINDENVKFNQERDDWVIEAMEEYARLYHESKVKELNIPAVRITNKCYKLEIGQLNGSRCVENTNKIRSK